MTTPALAIAVSGGGSNLQAVIDAIAAGSLRARIALVISDRPECGGVQRAIVHRLPVCALPYPAKATPAQRLAWEQVMQQMVMAVHPDLFLLSGFMRILNAETLAGFTMPVINQHPSLLPMDGGDTVMTHNGHVIPALRGAHVVRDALTLRLPVTGCTIHTVVPEVDRGPVIATAEVPVHVDDDEAALHARIRAVEQPLLIATLQQILT